MSAHNFCRTLPQNVQDGLGDLAEYSQLRDNCEPSFRGRACGMCIELTSPSLNLNAVPAVVAGKCDSCGSDDLLIMDSPTSGDSVADSHGVQWRGVKCDEDAFAFVLQKLAYSPKWEMSVAVKRWCFGTTSA